MPLSARIHDAAILNDMRRELKSALNSALIKCAIHAMEFQQLNTDEVLAMLRAQFDPTVATTSIQDCFTNAFHAAHAEVNVASVTDLKSLPSGCVL